MSLKSQRILLIEDDINLSKVLTHILSKEGYEVRPCLTGKAALELIQHGFVADLVILDLELPDIQGLTLLEEIKLYKPYEDIPVIINSGHPQLKSDFHSWLADAYVVKQSNPSGLTEVVRRILKLNLESNQSV